MRTLRRLFLVIALLVVGGYFYVMAGRPFQLPEGKIPDVKTVLEAVTTPKGGPVTVYRWRNDKGHWTYGSTPPPGTAYETVTVDPDQSVLPSSPTDKKEKESGGVLPFSQEQIRQMFEQASRLSKQPDESAAEPPGKK